MHAEKTGTGTLTIDFGQIKSIMLTAGSAVAKAVLTDADSKTIIISSPANDTNQLVMPGPPALVFNMKAPIAAVITGDSSSFLRVDG